MTQAEKENLVKALVDNDTEATTAVVDNYLLVAEANVSVRLFPFGVPESGIPTRYDNTICQLAARYFLRRGAEGELTHSENGVNRGYASTNDEDILSTLTPFAKV